MLENVQKCLIMKNIQKNNIWIVENSYTDKMKILRKYWKIKKY